MTSETKFPPFKPTGEQAETDDGFEYPVYTSTSVVVGEDKLTARLLILDDLPVRVGLKGSDGHVSFVELEPREDGAYFAGDLSGGHGVFVGPDVDDNGDAIYWLSSKPRSLEEAREDIGF